MTARIRRCLTIARQCADDDERMASRIAQNWSKFVALDLEQQGVE